MEAVPGITREEVVYCGDSDVDMMTGKNAGVRTIGVTWGFRSREELSGHNPWILVDRPEEITDALTEGKE
jgi:phosphoglycolate phosphatase